MCGFTGYIYTQSQEETSTDTILEMLALQRHRGPDDSGILGIAGAEGKFEEMSVAAPKKFECAPKLIFGFNRLSILDLSPNGHQPMLHEATGVALMMNGEVYNAFDYKEELLAKGFTFKGSSDTEVVLYLYVAYGLDGMLSRLNGMFALSIYDGRSKELYLVRDRMGIKPLYVLKQDHRIAFASEMKSFKALPDFQFELEQSNLSEFLIYRNTINGTLFKNIVNITPGSYMTICMDGSIQQKVYYDLRREGPVHEGMNNRLVLEKALKNSVKRQMISDVKLGCQLSGGVDSSLVTASAAEEVTSGSLETVSIVFEEQKFSEKKYIDQVAEQFQLKSHQFTLDAKSYFELIEEATWHFEQPLNHPNTIGIKLLSREARKHVTVLLSGEGADESLAGYTRFLPTADTFWSIQNLKKIIKNKRFGCEYSQMLNNKRDRYLLHTAFGGLEIAASLYPGFSTDQAMSRRRVVWDSLKDTLGRKKRKYELLSYLPDLLMRQDKMSMAHSIENRVPFLDNEMISASLSLSDEDLVNARKGKWEGKVLLKDLCADIFSEDFAYRDKMGFGIPLKAFFESADFKIKWKEEYLPGMEKRGIFCVAPLKEWMGRPTAMTAEQLDAVWLMVGFEIWAKQYLD